MDGSAFLLGLEEKTLAPIAKSLNTEGEANFVEEEDGLDFGYIEFDLVVLVVYQRIVERVFCILFSFKNLKETDCILTTTL